VAETEPPRVRLRRMRLRRRGESLLFLTWELLQDEKEKEKGRGSFLKKNQKTFASWRTQVERIGEMSRTRFSFRKRSPSSG
jgi:hypothetical protein